MGLERRRAERGAGGEAVEGLMRTTREEEGKSRRRVERGRGRLVVVLEGELRLAKGCACALVR